MEDKAKKRRDWIKNIAIIFLVIMLVLTFFSNTIMNYSLPEVSAQYTNSGNVASRVRGTATVEAVQPYEIKIEEKRSVEEVKVHAGDTIKKGQVLFILGNSDGTALDEAQEALDTAIFDYQQKLLKDMPDYSTTNLEIGFAKEDYRKAMEAEKEAKKNDKKVISAKEKVEEGKKEVTKHTRQMAEYDKIVVKLESDRAKEVKNPTNVELQKEELQKAKDALENLELIAGMPNTGVNYTLIIKNAKKEVDKAQENLDQAKQVNLDAIDLNIENTKELKAKSNDNLIDANAQLQLREAELAEAQKGITLPDAQKATLTAKRAYEKMIADLEKTQGTDSNAQQIANLETSNMKKKITRMEKKVNRLKVSSSTNEIVSKVAGVVSTVGYVAGDTTAPETPMAVIQLTDRGYTAKLTVTNEKSAQVREGNVAEILNIWNSDIKATLTSIKNDPENPGKNKILVFTVTGDVTLGQSLELAVGDKSGFYDTIVPNSAIREDNKGKFLLTVQVKSSPLGNRYVATRLNIEVIVADETNSAISGSINGSEFVISTSTKPIQPGMQVRMVEGGDA
ncbi:MAG: HlyD family efflux transporter periplasmic adaptor subunit [Acetivibrio sp.]